MAASDLVTLGVKQAAQNIRTRELSAVELAEAYLARIEARNKALNAYITVTADQALAAAKEADKRVKDGKARLLEGVPLGIKDLFCTKGVLTTAASHILDGFVPPYESTVTANLWKAGAVNLGKLNLDEFAMGGSGETSYYGPSKNPWDETRVPGGSSSGSSAAVADFLCAGATGTDTGGSIRQPASYTGIVGLKPTYGRCSRWGIVAFASSLDQAGPMARSVEDVAIMLRAMSGFDPMDSTSADRPIESYDEGLDTLELKGLKVGLPEDYFGEGLDPRVRQIVEDTAKKLEREGAEIIKLSLPHTRYAGPTYYILAPAEAASNLSRYDGMRYGLRVEGKNLLETYCNTRSRGFGAEVKRRIMVGNHVLSSGYYEAYYGKAQKVRALIAQDFAAAFKQVDILLTPTAPTPAFKIGGISDPVQMYLQDVFTLPTSLAGLPGMSVPAGMVEEDGKHLPVGVQLIGPAFAERKLLQVGFKVEQLAQMTNPLQKL